MSDKNHDDRDYPQGYDPEKNNPFDGAYEYPEVDHPEDRADFGSSAPRHSAEEPGPAGYGDYPSGYPGDTGNLGMREVVGTHVDLNQPMVVNDGVVDVFESFGYAFKVTFKRWGIWLTIGLLGLLGTAGAVLWSLRDFDPSVPESVNSSYADPTLWVFVVVYILIGVLFIGLAVSQVEGKPFGFSDGMRGGRYGVGLGAYFLSSLIYLALVAIPMLLQQLAVDPNTNEVNWAIFGGSSLATMLLGIFVMPLFQFAPYFALDGRAGVLGSVKESVNAVRANYWPTVGFMVLFQIIVFALVFMTCGLGVILALPFSYNATAHFYRQLVGGPVPRKN